MQVLKISHEQIILNSSILSYNVSLLWLSLSRFMQVKKKKNGTQNPFERFESWLTSQYKLEKELLLFTLRDTLFGCLDTILP